MSDSPNETYLRFISSSQRIFSEMITLISHQEVTLRAMVNNNLEEDQNTIRDLRNENIELRTSLNRYREQENFRRQRQQHTPQNRLFVSNSPSIPSNNVSPLITPNRIIRQTPTLPRPQIPTIPNIPSTRNDDLTFRNGIRNEPVYNSNISENQERQRNPFVQESLTNNETTPLTVPNNQNEFVRRYFGNMDDILFNAATNVNQRLRNNIANFAELSPVIIRPSTRQIRDATQLVRFETIIEPPNVTCPISLERFSGTDLVTRIVFCGHVFSTESIQTWFENNVRCPLCRFDIREHGNRMSAENRNLSPVREETNNETQESVPSQTNTYVSRNGNVNTISEATRNSIMELYDTDSDDSEDEILYENYAEMSLESEIEENIETMEENINNLLLDDTEHSDYTPRPPPPPPSRYTAINSRFQTRPPFQSPPVYDVSNSLQRLQSALTENLLQDISQNGYAARITFINSFMQTSDSSFNYLRPFSGTSF